MMLKELLMKRLEWKRPNLFVAGAMKAGTTALFHLLRAHPDIYMSPIKEPHFFSTDIDTKRFAPAYKPRPLDMDRYCRLPDPPEIHSTYVTKWENYHCLFKNARDQKIIGEASTSYLYSQEAAFNIQRSFHDARIIIVLRDPVERAFSHFQMDCAIGRVKGTFRDEIEKDMNASVKGWGISRLYIELGMYYEQLQRFLNCFPKQQILILLFDDLKRRNADFIDKISCFLGIDKSSFLLTDQRHNLGIKPRFASLNYILHTSNLKNLIRTVLPKPVTELGKKVYYGNKDPKGASPEDVRLLRPFFNDDVRNLSRLINRDLSHWMTIKK
jgi:hypothetical protein